MTPEQQRIAIAKACGWKINNLANLSTLGGLDCNDGVYPPDYLNDLNAMAEAESTLDGPDISDPDSLRFRYSHFIYLVVPMEQQPFRANAAQRAEAFLRTLNLWKDL